MASKGQTIASYAVIAALLVILCAVLYTQRPAVPVNTGIQQPMLISADLFGAGFAASETVEKYTSENLYEKIDGKAGLYLSNGFVSLQSRRFIDKSAKANWAEVYLYDMAEPQNSFAVYSMQRRSGAKPLNWTQSGYYLSDSVYAALGRFYIEILLSEPLEKLLSSANAAARQLGQAVGAGDGNLEIFKIFPKENLLDDSFKFIDSDAFGCSGLNGLFAAQYKIQDKQWTAFFSRIEPAEKYDLYRKFVFDNGGEEIEHNLKITPCTAADLFGNIEIFFTAGGYFAGIRGEADLSEMQKASEKLYGNLQNERR